MGLGDIVDDAKDQGQDLVDQGKDKVDEAKDQVQGAVAGLVADNIDAVRSLLPVSPADSRS